MRRAVTSSTPMNVDPQSPYYDEFRQFQKKMQNKLRNLREVNQLTQQDLAEAGISQRHYERMEQKPEAITTLWQMFQIAKFYDVPISSLLDVE